MLRILVLGGVLVCLDVVCGLGFLLVYGVVCFGDVLGFWFVFVGWVFFVFCVDWVVVWWDCFW